MLEMTAQSCRYAHSFPIEQSNIFILCAILEPGSTPNILHENHISRKNVCVRVAEYSRNYRVYSSTANVDLFMFVSQWTSDWAWAWGMPLLFTNDSRL